MIKPEVFYGQVVDIHDPTQTGLVKIRIHEIHANTVLDEDLPWVPSMMGATSGSTNGSGGSSTGLRAGDEVAGFFRDLSKQDPVICWTWHSDTDLNPLVLGQDSEATEKRTDDKTVVTTSGVEFTEPVTDYTQTKYPYNYVEMSRSGHIFENDDTPGRERMSWMHRLGSYFEYQHNGDTVSKSVRDRYYITERNHHSHIGGVSKHSQTGHATNKYSATLYTKTAAQQSYVADNLLIKVNDVAEIRAEILNVIAELAVSESLTVPTIKASSIVCDNLSVKSVIQGTAQFAMAAAKANKISGGAPTISEGAGNTQTNPLLKDTDGVN